MKIADASAFLPHEKLLTIGLIKGDSKQFVIALNFSVGAYYKMLCLMDQIKGAGDDISALDDLIKIAEEILKKSDNPRSAKWIADNISTQNMIELVNTVFTAIDELLSSDYFKIPEININKTPAPKTDNEKERQKKKEEIDKYNKLLDGKRDVFLIDDIALVMSKTNNSYSDVLNMPLFIFKDLVRTLIINENKTNDDWLIEYLKLECEKAKIELTKSASEEKSAQSKGADLAKLKRMLNQ